MDQLFYKHRNIVLRRTNTATDLFNEATLGLAMTQTEQLRQEMATIRIGECAAQQPLSGVSQVGGAAVYGHGPSGYERQDNAKKA